MAIVWSEVKELTILALHKEVVVTKFMEDLLDMCGMLLRRKGINKNGCEHLHTEPYSSGAPYTAHMLQNADKSHHKTRNFIIEGIAPLFKVRISKV